MKLASRVARIKPSPTLAVTAKAKAMKAEGIDVIGFGAGEPDFDTPDNIKDEAKKALDAGFTKYTPVGGIDELKDAIINKFEKDNGLRYEKSQVLVSCGGKHSLFNLFMALINEGDEVVIPAPYWVSYPDMVLLADGKPVIIETSDADNFKISPDMLKRAITDKTKAFIINSPSNPTGAAYSEDELKGLAEVCLEKDILVISDEIYEKIVYDGFKFSSIAGFGDDIKAKTIVVNGVSKAYSMTGWRIGYMAGDEAIIKAAQKIQSQSTSNPNSIAQKASVEALNGPQDDVAKMVEAFLKRRNYILARLNDMDGVRCNKPEGSFYVFPNLSPHCKKKFNGKDIENDAGLNSYLLEEARVAAVPGSAFGAEGYLRLSYATDMESIEKGIDRIEKALAKLE